MRDTKQEVELKLMSMSEVEAKSVDWLLYPFIPFGKITIIQGDPGEGKTTLALQIISKLTTGEPIIPIGIAVSNESVNDASDLLPMNVIYQTAEDGLADTIKPRLDAAKADCTKVLVIDDSEVALTMDDKRLADAIKSTGARLVVLDPIQGYLGSGVDMHRANEIRPVMKKLATIAEENNCAVILIGHMNKNSQGKSSYRGLGSIDFQAAARSVLIVGRHKEHPDIRIVCHDKSSLAPEGVSIAFKLDKENGFEWIGEFDISATDLLSGSVKNNKTQEAILFLNETLANGSVESSQVMDTAKQKGISPRTLAIARKMTSVESKRVNNRWMLSLPAEDDK